MPFTVIAKSAATRQSHTATGIDSAPHGSPRFANKKQAKFGNKNSERLQLVWFRKIGQPSPVATRDDGGRRV